MPSLLLTNPQGVLIPHIPDKLAAIVNISARYIFKGSLDICPILKAGVGDVGEMIASTLSKALLKSSLIRVLTF